MTRWLLSRKLVGVVAAWALWISVSPGRAFALPSESVSAFQAGSCREAQIEKIMSVLSRPEAQVHLRTAGIDPTGLRGQLAKLDDAQLATVAEKADAVKAGGFLGLIIALLVIAILVVILIYLLNKDIEIKDKDKDKD